MRVRVGRWFVAIGWSMWPGLGWHWINGTGFAPILMRTGPVGYGRGIVASLGGVMLWVTRDAR